MTYFVSIGIVEQNFQIERTAIRALTRLLRIGQASLAVRQIPSDLGTLIRIVVDLLNLLRQIVPWQGRECNSRAR
ncbi:hypothetical protein [Aquabacterium sp. A08]|uniref:hypothetical protein n=1 Tax=Aquabacterium sp. A08 TaxID=2718532 RepID=UPI00141E834D|nr:hypothetical protein [Aquabacterium sp. A08]NIC41859.1 hypothetical protein [Aquabacterium sp. A08]